MRTYICVCESETMLVTDSSTAIAWLWSRITGSTGELLEDMEIELSECDSYWLDNEHYIQAYCDSDIAHDVYKHFVN